ncbi:hypothetical protein [Luteibacter sp. ME-Dv--P-043b]|uniref:hypothetical protein n=1 Tax=Luteibacter sp. ME-Dv--P-043b TaxID=3040291 RepID=UPI002556E365|nr:hypothetical protein [Luteibacter sp. ME-Dv--P-043b]
MFSTLDITPYFSITLLEASPDWPIYSLVAAAKKRLHRAYEKVEWLSLDVDYMPSNTPFVTCIFSETHPPGWAKLANLTDKSNHYFTLALTNDCVIVHSSNNDARDRIVDALTDPAIAGLSRVPRTTLNQAFLVDESVRTLWLFGIHRRTGIKPDTKTLTGENLRLAINPLSDQSYSYNSARANLHIGRLNKVVGVNLNEASIWMHQLRSWAEFMKLANAASYEVSSAMSNPVESPISILPHPIEDIGAMKGAYDFNVPSHESHAQLSESQIDRLNIIQRDIDYEVVPQFHSDNVIRLSIHDYVTGGKFFIGIIEATPMKVNKRLRFSLDCTKAQPGTSTRLKKAAQLLFGDASLVQAWYESAHCISAGQCFHLSYSETRFRRFHWGFFKGFDIRKEKPLSVSGTVDLTLIATAGEDSLFSWVHAALKRTSSNPLLAHLELKTADHWLLCDDGAGEAADFIHVNLSADRAAVTFIHVKAASSSSIQRKLSVTAHDVVLSQATKNLHLLDDQSFVDQLEDRLKKSGNKLAWDGNGPVSPAQFIAAIRAGTVSRRIQFHVVVVQPHTLRSFYRKSSGSKMQRRQLDTLLISARYALAGYGSELVVIGSADL